MTQTVPDEMLGCWRREWIAFADGRRDDTTHVWWLQLPSLMADVRIPAHQAALAARGGLRGCSADDLAVLAEAEASTGYTTCSAVVAGPDGVRRATAEWHTRGHGVAFHPVSAWPEPGELEWSADGTVMIEKAPSGAYTEQWRLVGGSRDRLEVVELGVDRMLYRAGPVGVIVRDRPTELAAARLPELLAACGDDRAAAAALFDCEFSVAELTDDDRWVVVHSTLPWKRGEVIGVSIR